MKPILFNTDMVKAILDGRKTQTRRLIKNQPKVIVGDSDEISEMCKTMTALNAKYQVGDVLWVRERARLIKKFGFKKYQFEYEADNSLSGFIEWPERIKQFPMHRCVPNGCFKELARIFLRVADVRVERVQDISDADCKEEGIERAYKTDCVSFNPIGWKDYQTGKACFNVDASFISLWESCYPGSWDRNDFVFVYEFEMIEK